MMTTDPSAVEYDQLDPSALTYDQRYKFLTASVVPRPIALVTTLSDTGIVNAAPYSQFIIIAVDPPLLGIVAGQGVRGDKDTLRYIRASGEYVINTVPESLAHQVQACAEPVPPDVSEVDIAGLNISPSRLVRPPRIRESKLQFECRLHRMVDFGIRKSTLIVGEVVLVHATPGVLSGHRVEHSLLTPLGRIGGRRYCRTNDVIDT